MKKTDRALWLCVLLCAGCAFLSFIGAILKGKGFFYLSEDFNKQQIAFTMALNRQIKAGGLDGWCWDLDLGTGTIPGYSFYELGSPFFWLTMLFPAGAVPYLIGWIYILKYIVAGVTSYFYIARFVRKKEAAVLGALLYAFSGFQTTNLLFYHFHDVVALFPLMLIGLERMMDREEGKSGLWIAAVALNAVLNYFFFLQEAIFLVLYFLIRFGTKDPALFAKRFIRSAVTALIGTLAASFLLLPSFLYIRDSARGSGGLVFFSLEYLTWSARDLLFVIKGFLFPGESMTEQSIVNASYFNSTTCYLPLFGPAFALAYLLEKKDWLSRLLKLLVIISFVPILSAAFLLFTGLYHRWWFMLVLMLALATAKVAEEPQDYPVKKSLLLTVCAVAVFCVCIRFLPYEGESLVYDPARFAIYGGLALAGPIAALVIYRIGRRIGTAWLIASAAFAVLTTALTLHAYQYGIFDIGQIRLGQRLQVLDGQYRYATDDNLLTMPGGVGGIGAFSSTTANALTEFDALMDFVPANSHFDKTYIPGLAELFGAKYQISEEKGEAADTIVLDGDTYYVNEVPAAPIGFAIDRYIRREDLMSLELWWRGIALMQAPVVAPEDEEAVAGLALRVSGEMLDLNIAPEVCAEELAARSVRDFSRDVHGFSCRTDAESESLYWFSVPYDPGWEALIDGEKAPVIDSGGMILLDVPGGEHTISFVYHTPGLRAGCLVSLLTLAGCLFAWLIRRRLSPRPGLTHSPQENA